MGRYCPQFTAVTGEKITWRSGGHVIGEPHSAVVFAEIDLHKIPGFTLNPFTIIMNDVRSDLSPLTQRYFQDKYKFSVQDNPCSNKSVLNYCFKLGQANIGQKKDIRALRKMYKKHIAQYPDTDVVLYGDSRGAATIFNFIACHKPQQVKAAVIEGVFDTVPHCIKHFMYSDKEKRTEDRLNSILAFTMGSYNRKGPFPRDYASRISDRIPLLLVTSLNDGTVPPQCTLYLYKQLKKRRLNNVHLLVLKKAPHTQYMTSNPEDRRNYQNVVHAFYKQYGLPHNKKRAAAGQQAFAATQPTVAQVNKTYQLPTCILC